MTTKPDHRSESQAQAQLDHIVELMKEREAVYNKEDDQKRTIDEIEEDIHNNALDISVRSDWHNPSSTENCYRELSEYRILLCTGGPAVQIIGELDKHCQPDSARLQHQDWGTPWTDLGLSPEQQDTLLEYCQQFYFGE